VAYRVRASFLPGKNATVQERLEELAMHKMDITNGAVLERGCVYIVPLLEHLALKSRTSALGNPKSSTGRLDVFTRLITDHGTEFDRVRKGTRLSQIRIRRGNPPTSDEAMRRLHQEGQLVGAVTADDIRNGVPIS